MNDEIRIYLKLLFTNIPAIYTGNPKTIYSRFIIFILNPKHIYTFDDGIGNISNEGYFYFQNNFTLSDPSINFIIPL